MVSWSYIVTCKKCGYISSEKLPEKEARKLKYAHLEASKDCSTGHVQLMKVRT
jgi:hypothetical protein